MMGANISMDEFLDGNVGRQTTLSFRKGRQTIKVSVTLAVARRTLS